MQPDNSHQNHQKQYDEAFKELTSQVDILDFARDQFFRIFERNLQRMGIKCTLERVAGHVAKGLIYGNEDMCIEFSPIKDNGVERPMMRWHEYDGVMLDLSKREGLGIHGKYIYQARFVLKSNDWDPQKAEDFDLSPDDFIGEFTIATLDCEGWDFQEFIQDVLYHLSEFDNVRFYPQLARKLTGF